MKKQTFDFTLKESDIAFIGVLVTIVLYVMNIFGTGIIVGGDVGHIGSGIPLYGLLAPIIFTAFATFAGYYTKRHSMNKAFVAIYITLLLPFVSYSTVSLFMGTPLVILPMYLAMPVSSLHTYLNETYSDLLSMFKITITDNFMMAFILAVILIPIIVAPIAYRFTRTQEKED